jgi:hypothetical protein
MALFNFEHKDRPLAPTGRFAGRLIGNLMFALVVIAIALAGGMAGYYYLVGGLTWVDAFLNAAMILGGMGPVDPVTTDAGKLFAGGYALFSGLLFVVLAGVVLAPVLHRVLHALHVEDDDRR